MKLKHYGVENNLLNWISDFLHDRTQQVVVRGVKSDNAAVKSGVPQETVLGPLLFLVYINDMPERVKSTLALFADDSYIHKEIDIPSYVEDLQKDIDELVEWEKEWNMEFHPWKCKMLRITNKRKIIESNYYIHGEKLENVTEAKYLGVTLDKSMTWKSHIAKVTTKANNCRIFLQRNLTNSSRETRLLCYVTYVRPIVVEYAASVWDPIGNATLSKKVEMVQRKAAHWINNDWKRNSSPSEMLKLLSLNTLQERRNKAKMKMFYDIINGNKFVSESIIPKRQRCLDVRFKPIRASILSSSIDIWNKIPRSIVNIDDVKKFKSEIDNLIF